MVFVKKTIFLCIFIAEIVVSAQLEVGDVCGQRGDRVCTLARDCKEAVIEIEATRTHSLEKCGQKGIDEIVCCTDTTKDEFPLRRSTLECIKYWENTEPDYTPFVSGPNASLGEFPDLAALGYEDDSNGTISWSDCSGSLISKNFVLTAAHCLVRQDRKVPVMVRLGKVDLFGNVDGVLPQDIKVAENIIHPQFNYVGKVHDIALIRLEKHAQFNENVKPICLYPEETIPNNEAFILAGWGRRSIGENRFLQRALVKPVDLDSCNQTYATSPNAKPLFESQLCALPPKFPGDVCERNFGGSLDIMNRKLIKLSPLVLVGVSSFGRGCNDAIPDVYTSVLYYLDWIEAVVWPN